LPVGVSSALAAGGTGGVEKPDVRAATRGL